MSNYTLFEGGSVAQPTESAQGSFLGFADAPQVFMHAPMAHYIREMVDPENPAGRVGELHVLSVSLIWIR